MSTIRPAKLTDAKQLAASAEATFTATFSEQNSLENIESYCQTAYGESIQAQEITSSEYITLVADDNNQLIAFAQLRWGSHPQCISAESPGEIQKLYIAKHWHGQGLAHQLMSACLDVMKERNNDLAWLGVWENNPRAIAFYQKFDFQPAGEHIFTLGNDPQRDIILSLPL